MPTPGRNEPCSCGSGSKFKKCCGPRLDVLAESIRLDVQLVELLLKWAAQNGVLDEIQERVGEVARDPDRVDSQDVVFAMPWALYHARFEGRTVAEQLPEPPGRLGEWLRQHRQAWLSAWEVLRVAHGMGMALRDLLTGEERFVYDRSGSESVESGLAILARVVDFGGISVLGGVYPLTLPPMAVLGVVEEFRRQWPGEVQVQDLQEEERTRSLVAAWRKGTTRSAAARSMVNFDGDPVQMVRDTCPVTGLGEVRLRLQELEGDEHEEDGKWVKTLLRPPLRAESGQREPVMWARLLLGTETLTLETNSLRRADELRTLVEGLGLGPFSRELVEMTIEAPARPRPPLLPELATLVRQRKEELYADWTDAPLPALDGRSAAEEVRSAEGRARVEALLREMEMFERRAPEAERYDFDQLRSRLGLLG